MVITGLIGSGKSSLVFDTLDAEWQRPYVESLSAYTRQFLDQTEKPDVDFIEGLSLPSPSSSAGPGRSQDRRSRLQLKFTVIWVCFFRRSVNRRSHPRGGHLKRLTITAISPRTPTSTASLPLVPPDYSGRSPLVAHRQIQFFIWTRRSISLRPEYRRNAASGRFHYFLGNLGVYIVTPLSQITT